MADVDSDRVQLLRDGQAQLVRAMGPTAHLLALLGLLGYIRVIRVFWVIRVIRVIRVITEQSCARSKNRFCVVVGSWGELGLDCFSRFPVFGVFLCAS